MKITYIGHSGFLVEIDNIYLLFDYFEGTIPNLDQSKELIVFASHNHHDHYNPKIWKLNHPNEKTRYILSSDIPLVDNKMKNVYEMNPNEMLQLENIVIRTYKSTDEGVAFLIEINHKIIYHAGDLNLWKWEEESDAYNKKMEAQYLKEIDLISPYVIDIAFLPLDPRQEIYTEGGIEAFVDKVKVNQIFPMHFWKDYGAIQKYNQTHSIKVNEITYEGQEFNI